MPNLERGRGERLVLNATFNNISAISWWRKPENPEKPDYPTYRKSLTNFIT